MSILPITMYGHKILREKTSQVESISDSIVELIMNMQLTMKNAWGVGIAANQVGVNRQIFIADVSDLEGYKETNPIIAINPKIFHYSSSIVKMEEGCLSIPGIKGEVPRSEEIELIYYDGSLNKRELKATGFLARVIQHEYDHLQGKLFIDYLDDQSKKLIKKKLLRIQNLKIDIDYPFAKHNDYLIL